jgi:hypothetical protein
MRRGSSDHVAVGLKLSRADPRDAAFDPRFAVDAAASVFAPRIEH